jgi:hypothetical protein
MGAWLGLSAGSVAILAAVDCAHDGGSGAEGRAIALAAMYFCTGAFTAASYAWFMDLTDVELGATQFSLFMSATNGCESWATRAAGAIKEAAGYPAAMAVGSAVSLLALLALCVSSRWRSPGGRS